MMSVLFENLKIPVCQIPNGFRQTFMVIPNTPLRWSNIHRPTAVEDTPPQICPSPMATSYKVKRYGAVIATEKAKTVHRSRNAKEKANV